MSIRKLIIYCDASFTDGKYGWCYKIFLNQNGSCSVLGYGCDKDSGISSGHAEIESSNKALVNLSNHSDITLDSIDLIEIRSDFLNLVTFINKRDDPKFEKRLIKGYYKCYAESLLKLLSTINLLPFKVIAKKVTKKDENLKQVDRYAKYALNNLTADKFNYYVVNKGNVEKILDRCMLYYTSHETKEVLKVDKLVPWYKDLTSKVVEIPIFAIDINEEIHLNAAKINFNCNLKNIKGKGCIDIPIAVKSNGDSRYTLIAGISRLCIAKLLNFNTIPAIILKDIDHIEFLLKYMI